VWNFTIGVNASATSTASNASLDNATSGMGDGVTPMDTGEGEALAANRTAGGGEGGVLRNASDGGDAENNETFVDRRYGLLRNSKYAEWKLKLEKECLHAAATAVLNPRSDPEP